MATPLDDLSRSALLLPAEARAQLADLLVESLDTDDLSAVDLLWLAQAKRRREDLTSGNTATVSAADAIEQVRRSVAK